MNRLERNHHKPDGANKYHINCNELEKNPSLIPVIFNKIIKMLRAFTPLHNSVAIFCLVQRMEIHKFKIFN